MSHFGKEKYFSNSESWQPEGIVAELQGSFGSSQKAALFSSSLASPGRVEKSW